MMLRILTLALLLFSLSALAQTPTPELTVPPDVLGYRMVGNLLVGVTRSGKIVSYDVTNRANPLRRAEVDAGAKVLELRLVDGIVLAICEDKRVRAFVFQDDGTAQALQLGAGQGTATPSRKLPQILGKIVEARRGNVLIELNDVEAVVPGDRLVVRSRTPEERLNLLTGTEEAIATNATTALVEVTQVDGKRAVAELNRGDLAVPGDTVELGEKTQEISRSFPRRGDFKQWARLTIRPMANIGAIDIASLTDLGWGYYGSWFHVQVRIQPLGISIPRTVDALNAHGIFSWSGDFAEFGIGFGYFRETIGVTSSYECGAGSVLNDTPRTTGGIISNNSSCTKQGFSFVQHVRLGSLDGLNLRATNTTVISDGFRWGLFDASLDIPLTRTLNLYFGGGASNAVRYGEFGIRTYLRGIGGRDTVILSTGLGGTGLTTAGVYNSALVDLGGSGVKSTSGGETTLSGPHFAIGAEYRF